MAFKFLTTTTQRYTVAGAVIGSAAPLLFVSLDIAVHGVSSAFGFMFSDPLRLATSAIPVICATAGFFAGQSQQTLHFHFRELAASAERYHREARFDRLTGLANRYCLEDDIARMLGRGNGSPVLGTMLLLDLDRFKFVNDTMGHDAGDELLVALGSRLADHLGGRGQVYRLGGDEFVILLSADDTGDIDAFCMAIQQEAGKPFDLSEGRIATGVSIGVAAITPVDRELAPVLKRADMALYEAKAVNGPSYATYCPKMAKKSLARIEIERDLGRAFADGEFFIEYQPIVGVESGRIRSFEALLRWRHPQKGIIEPDRFIPLAEKTGLIVRAGKWVMSEACREAAKWPSPTGVAVNVAGDQFKDGTFVEHVRTCLAESGLAPGRLTVEVTESLFTVEIDVIRDSLAALRQMGVRIALDDFGTGFASISNLRDFPLDQLKIDRTFAKAMVANQRDASLVELILRLGRTFNLTTTIEGIETVGQMDLARALGVSEAQGFLISVPVPADEVPAMIERERTGRMLLPHSVTA
ncbi:bifunctional diguanylate cyclase/phosphodiesterase [Rhizobiaceae bacterium n13]|uniref:Bifunctional diguanylate cyclase/phosphodiesterase n=1 Tax=Ferirhizobium litorale TaxID=2927786 RepID=A0AAE3U3T1_9HYPH|nr:bifunctional diguanylate cyclase/phosphodiesterase [Fererhizobium litorale]MDI7863768.1 bifunctional diguanylate cyclase/phosphodiesterase [Fererhizobium litorale]MDI7924132.1 bifunctional diguanylate cyclase/phosphodiesterase [Fererhizobium litorale]